MWAGSRIEFLAPIAVGARLTRVATIDAIKPKRGASGDLLFVTLRHDIAADGVAAIREEQDIVFREPATTAPAPTPAAAIEPESPPTRCAAYRPIRYSCSAIRRSPSTPTASTTTATMRSVSRAMRGSSSTAR